MTAKTVAIGVALVLVGVLVGLNVPIAEAQRGGSTYVLGNSPNYLVWRLNTQTGQVSRCRFKGEYIDATISPTCTPWTAAGR